MRIGLGTVQFGLPYGVTNEGGRVRPAEAAEIIKLAAASGVDTIDTASLYGESEAVLGSIGVGSFRIVTKTPKFGSSLSRDTAREQVRSAFAHSLEKLDCRRVYGLLLHDATDLLGPLGPALWGQMMTLKEQGLVAKIGVSAYEGSEIDQALDRYPIDLVQLPFNPIDDRLVAGGQLERLKCAGVEIHGRSLFLQGLLLQAPEQIPPLFAPIAEAVVELHAASDAAGLTPLEGVLAMAFQRREIDRFVCGVTSAQEWQAIVSAAKKAERVAKPIRFATHRPLDARFLNPARWPELASGGSIETKD